MPADDEEPPGNAKEDSAFISELLRYCVRDTDPGLIGRRLVLLAYVSRWPLGIQNQTELGRLLGVGRRRVSQLLREVRLEIAQFRPG
jgi:hypothetical protein